MINNSTINDINKECFAFLQQLINKYSSICLEKDCFGGIHTQWPTQTVENCVIPLSCDSAFLQSLWTCTMQKITKLVGESVKAKKHDSCTCTTTLHTINDLVVLCTPLTHDQKSNCFDVCVTWYVNCCYLNDVDNECDNGMSRICGWPLYQLSDNITSGRDEVHHMTQNLLEQGIIATPLVIQIPHTYVNQPLQNVGEVVILTNKCMHHARHDNIVGEHTMMDRNNPITPHDTIILCCRGFHKDCFCNCLHTGHQPLHTFVKSSNALLAPNHLFLHDCPYDHEPQDQLKPVQDKITHTCIGTEQHENIDENEQACWCVDNVSFVNQHCFWQ